MGSVECSVQMFLFSRAEVAARARQLKRDGKLDDTWTRDGIIFVKKGDSVHRITTVREIHVFN